MMRHSPRPALAVLLSLLTACEVPPVVVGDGTAAMIERLAPLADETDVERNRFANEAIIAALIAEPRPVRADARLLFDRQLNEQLLYAGRHGEAIAGFTTLLADLSTYEATAAPSQRAPRTFRSGIEDLLAISYLRLAEQTGCITDGQATDCALPPPRHGVDEYRRHSFSHRDLPACSGRVSRRSGAALDVESRPHDDGRLPRGRT